MKGNYGDKPFRGIYPALLTPISEDGKIKKEGLKKTGFLGDGKRCGWFLYWRSDWRML